MYQQFRLCRSVGPEITLKRWKLNPQTYEFTTVTLSVDKNSAVQIVCHKSNEIVEVIAQKLKKTWTAHFLKQLFLETI